MNQRILATARAGQELARAIEVDDLELRGLQARVLEAPLRETNPSIIDRLDEYASRRTGRRSVRAACALALMLYDMAQGALDAYEEP